MKAACIASLMVLAILPSAQAADLPLFSPEPLPIFSWTGLYAGSYAGYGTARGRATSTCVSGGPAFCDGFPGGTRPDGDGFVGGSQAGFSVETPIGLLLGVEGDIQFTRLRGAADAIGISAPLGAGLDALSIAHVAQSLDDFGTVRGRIGYAFGPALLYATGGLAFAKVRLDANRSDEFDIGILGNVSSESRLRTGYAVGGGVEYALTDHLSTKVEGIRYDLGSRSIAAADPGGFDLVRGAKVATNGYLVRAGLNYHFDGVPLAGLLRGALDPVEEGPAAPLGAWSLETGLRYFYSSGRYRKVLNDNVATSQMNSRLTFADAGANAGESFARLDHNPTGLFVKGYLGSGGFASGHLNDEDFPPALTPYSNTLSPVRGGPLSYADVDVGYQFWGDEDVNLAAFAGYHYMSETMNAYGCSQVAGGAICANPDAVPTTVKALSEDATWNALRVGGQVETRMDRLQLSAEAAYLPLVVLDAYDHHWLRPDINPLPEHGTGTGYQVEAVASYHVTPQLSVGAGGRYWYMEASRGGAQFPGTTLSPLKTRTDRYGGFVQAAYAFSE